jgi:cysteinyl-tRNA synthetase
VDDRKRDPLDFALWKAAKPGEPSWDSPWGPGRPGWHIECSAMSKKYLGLPLDVHGGGADLIFPHHENETAQSEAAYNTTFCNAWMHGGMLQINSEKMSKSLGNFLLLREVLKHTKPQVLRMLMLQAHYRSPLDFSQERLDEAATSLERIENALRNLMWVCDAGGEQPTTVDVDALEAAAQKMRADFIEAMDDDFNTADGISAIFEMIRKINVLVADTSLTKGDLEAIYAIYRELVGLMGFLVPEESEDTAWIDELILERAMAKKEKNYARADEIREELKSKGIILEDTAQGTKWKRA